MEWIKIFQDEKQAMAVMKEDVPQLIIVGEKRICLALHNGKFFAIQDKCTHSGESLSKGTVNYLGEIICPFHGYRFDLNVGAACDSSSPDLATYPVKTDHCGFFIGL